MEGIEKIKEVAAQAVPGAQIEIVNSTPAAQQPALAGQSRARPCRREVLQGRSPFPNGLLLVRDGRRLSAES
jgi:hypothetical protein